MVRPLQRFFAQHGLVLVDIQRIWTKGGSIRGFVRLNGRSSAAVADLIAAEERDGLYDDAPYERFASAVAEVRVELAEIVARERAAGRGVAGYGASVGTITLLHQFDLIDALDFIADDTPLGDAVEGPGYRISVVPPSQLLIDRPGVVIILAWRYADPIIEKNATYSRLGGRFVIPLPHLSWR